MFRLEQTDDQAANAGFIQPASKKFDCRQALLVVHYHLFSIDSRKLLSSPAYEKARNGRNTLHGRLEAPPHGNEEGLNECMDIFGTYRKHNYLLSQHVIHLSKACAHALAVSEGAREKHQGFPRMTIFRSCRNAPSVREVLPYLPKMDFARAPSALPHSSLSS